MILGQNKKPILYSFILILGFYFVLVSRDYSVGEFIAAIAINIVLLILMIANIWKSASNKLTQLGLPKVNNYPGKLSAIYHIVFPLLIFIDFCLLIYFNSFPLFRPILLILVFITYFFVFVNIRAYYEDKFKLELSTHFIYTLIILISSFALANAVLSISNLYSFGSLLSLLLLFIVNMCLIISAFLHYWDIGIKMVVVYLVFALILATVTILLFIEFDSTLRSSFIQSILMYFVFAILQHKFEGSLSLGIVFEYVIIALLGFVLLYGAG